MVNVIIDEFTPCLKDTVTGNIIETEVVRIKEGLFLSKYNKKTGWYVNWDALLKENEIYALVLKGGVDIQGLVALSPKPEFDAIYVSWMCTAPENNKLIIKNPRYSEVGGHLFAIAAQKSIDYGFGGAIMGFAADMKLVEHYCTVFNAEHLGMLHPYQFFIDEENAVKTMEVYTYEWTDDEL